MKENETCNKYEALFKFSSEKELTEHLEVCEDCRKEHEKMQKVSNLVKEISSNYEAYTPQRPQKHLLKLAAGLTILFLAFFSISNSLNNPSEIEIAYTESESIIAEMGLPTDEYGLLMIY